MLRAAAKGHLAVIVEHGSLVYVNAVVEVASERVSALPMSAHDIQATVVEAASVPRAPEKPDPLRNGILAAMMGTMLGLGLAFLMEVLEPSSKPRGKTG